MAWIIFLVVLSFLIQGILIFLYDRIHKIRMRELNGRVLIRVAYREIDKVNVDYIWVLKSTVNMLNKFLKKGNEVFVEGVNGLRDYRIAIDNVIEVVIPNSMMEKIRKGGKI